MIEAKSKSRYIAIVGLDWEGRRYEPGDDVSGLPPQSLKWLVEQGLVEATNSTSATLDVPQKGRDDGPVQ